MLSGSPQRGVSTRVSNAERDQAVRLLRTHLSDGRLSLDEFSERVEEAYAARTEAQLLHVFRDMPVEGHAPRPDRRSLISDLPSRVLPPLTPALICTAIWAFSGAHGSFWPEWVFLGCGALALKRIGGGRHPAPAQPDPGNEEAGATGPAPSPTAPAAGAGNEAAGGADEDRRVLATIVFIDIVDSTEKAAAVGDAAWGQVLGRFMEMARREMSGRRGWELFAKGDEIVTAFDGTARALQYASVVRDGVGGLGLQVRVGVHAGEVHHAGADVSGIALHIGHRVSETAPPDEIVVTSTVRDLVAGSGLVFEDSGDHVLRGVPDRWHLYRLAS